jgi:LPXTG-motif cell wall-anchored protein
MRLFALSGMVALLLSLGTGPALAQGSVSMEDNFFSPVTETISVGQSVTWTNNGNNPHTTTANNGDWDSGVMNSGDTFSFTFNSAGTFDYVCQIHVAEGMVGTIIVQAGDGGDGTLPPTGPSARSGPFVLVGLALLVGGAVVLLALRRRGTAGS